MNIYTSTKGHLCAEQNGRNLHSQYNPVKEAQRFVDSSIDNKPSIIVFLGAGLGYIQQELAHRFPETRIMSIYYDDVIYNNRQFSNEKISSWSPSSGISIHQFFTQYILEQDLKDISIIEWNPSALINSDLSLSVNKFLKMTIQQLNGNIKTTAVFGKKWIRNMICNYLSIDDYCSLDHGEAPVVIASSGPSLTKSIPQIIEYRKKFVLWALPSSLATLNYHGVIPDLLISTDPGYYGRFHLYSLQKNIPVAQPLTGSRGIWVKKNPILVLNQSFPFEEDLLKRGKMKFLSVPSNGTVSGTALELALQQSKNIFFAGLDLCFNDILSHSRPHSFDNILQSDTHRLQPVQSVYYKRASLAMADYFKGIRISQSLDTYRNWFEMKYISSEITLKRLNPSPVSIHKIPSGTLSELKDYPDVEKKSLFFRNEGIRERKKNIQKMLRNWEYGILNKTRDDLLYFIDTDSCINGIRNNKALNFIELLRRIYG